MQSILDAILAALRSILELLRRLVPDGSGTTPTPTPDPVERTLSAFVEPVELPRGGGVARITWSAPGAASVSIGGVVQPSVSGGATLYLVPPANRSVVARWADGTMREAVVRVTESAQAPAPEPEVTITVSLNLKLLLRDNVGDGAAAAADIRSSIGSGYVIEVRNAAESVIATGTGTGSLGGTGNIVTGSASVTFSADCDPNIGTFSARVRKADGTAWAHGTLGLAGQGTDFVLSQPVASGAVAAATISLTVPTTATPTNQHVVAINCGGNAYTDGSGRQWLADTHFSGGSASDIGGDVAGTQDDAIYSCERWGEGGFSYSIPMTDGEVTVTLHLAEVWDQITQPGQRVFSVVLMPGTGSETTISAIDLFALAGSMVAHDITRTVTVSGGALVIQFVPGAAQNPKVNGISVRSSAGVTYTPSAGGGDPGQGGSDPVDPGPGDTIAWVKTFKTLPHSAQLGTMPAALDWYRTGRPYNQNTIGNRPGDTRLVPWGTLFAAGSGPWPEDLAVEIGTCRLRGKRVSDGVVETIQTWPTMHRCAHNRDEYSLSGIAENDGVGPAGQGQTWQNTNAGTRITRRTRGGDFGGLNGSHIHFFQELGDGGDSPNNSRVPVNKTQFSVLWFDVLMRTVGWSATNNHTPIVNPASGASGTVLVGGLGMDSYTTEGWYDGIVDDIGIFRHVYLTNSWQRVWAYTCLPADIDTWATPPGVS